MHRPVFVMQVLPILVVTFILSVLTTNELRIQKFKQLGLAAVICSLLTLPFFVYHFNRIKQYYLVDNADFGVTATYYDILHLEVSFILTMVGWFTIILSAVFISSILIAGRASVWRMVLLISIFIGSILPLILSKSGNSVVVYPCIAAFGFVPIVIKNDARWSRICPAFLFVFLFISIAGAGSRLYQLNSNIQSIDDSLRKSEDKMIDEIARLHLPEPVYISGFHVQGVDPASLLFLAQSRKRIALSIWSYARASNRIWHQRKRYVQFGQKYY